MTSKQLVYEEIKRRTLENNIEENEIFTANDLATSLNLSRNTVSQYLNEGLKDEYVVENEQLCLFPDMMYDEEGEETLDRILEKIIAKIDGSIERYVLISFDISHGQVIAIKGTVPAVGMNYYKEEDWADLLNASYSTDTTGASEEVSEEIVMLERKPKLRRRKRKEEHGSAEQK